MPAMPQQGFVTALKEKMKKIDEERDTWPAENSDAHWSHTPSVA